MKCIKYILSGVAIGTVVTGYALFSYSNEIKLQGDISFLINQLELMKQLNEIDPQKKLCVQKNIALENFQLLSQDIEKISGLNMSGESLILKKRAEQSIMEHSKYFSSDLFSDC